MKKKGRTLAALAGLALLLSGCGAGPAGTDATPSPTPIVVEVEKVAAQGPVAEGARKLLSSYDRVLERAAQGAGGLISYTIPGDLLSKMAQDAEEMGVQAVNGRYQFTWRQGGTHVYEATGLEAKEELAAEPTDAGRIDTDAPMADEELGDLDVTGGGTYDRSYSYDVAEDFSGGQIEVTERLNGEITGHELFTFSQRSDGLYFADAALDLTANLDTLESLGVYLVAAGRLQKNRVDIIEYQVSSLSDVPSAAAMDWDTLKSTVTPLDAIAYGM